MKKDNIKKILRDLTIIFYPALFGKELPAVESTILDGKKWTRSAYLKKLFEVTGKTDLVEAINEISQTTQQEELSNQRSIPQDIKTMEEFAEQRKLKRAQAVAKAKADVQKEILARKESKAKRDAIINKYKDSKIYIRTTDKFTVPLLNNKSIEELDRLRKEARSNPAAFSKNKVRECLSGLSQTGKIDVSDPLVQNSVQQSVINFTAQLVSASESIPSQELAAQIYSTSTLNSLSAMANYNNPELIKIIPDTTDRQEFVSAVQTTAAIEEATNCDTKTILSVLVENKEIIDNFYPTSENLTDNLIISSYYDPNNPDVYISETNVGNLYEHSSDISDLYNFYEQNTDSFISDASELGRSSLSDSIQSTQWFAKGQNTLLEKVPFLAGKPVQIAGSFFQYRPGLVSLWSAKKMPVFTTGVDRLYQIAGKKVLFTPLFNQKLGFATLSKISFTTSEGFIGTGIGFRLGNLGISFTSVATTQGKQLAVNLTTNATLRGMGQATSQIFSKLGPTAIGTKVAAATGGLLTRLGFGALGAKVGALLGSVAPIVGNIIGAVLGFLAGKLIGPTIDWVRRNKEILLYLSALPLLSLGAPMAIVLAPPALGTIFLLRRRPRAFRIIGNWIIGTLAASFVSGVIIAMLSLLGFVVLAAFILFVINSGAYVVPPNPKSQFRSSESPYIDVRKTVDRPGPFQNLDLPLTITYNISIGAKKGTLSNIRLEDKCTTIKEGSSPQCPEAEGFQEQGIPDITPGQNFTFQYIRNFGSLFNDSLINDVVTVTASVSEDNNAKASSSVGLKIGNPPDECPNGWPVMGNFGITQGPGGGFSHLFVQAADFGTPVGTTVYATHTGVASVVVTTGAYRPLYVDITSSCGTGTITTRYAHLSDTYVSSGDVVSMGQAIGETGSDGTGPHLHYEFRGGINMTTPYVPKTIPVGCNDTYTCGNIP